MFGTNQLAGGSCSVLARFGSSLRGTGSFIGCFEDGIVNLDLRVLVFKYYEQVSTEKACVVCLIRMG